MWKKRRPLKRSIVKDRIRIRQWQQHLVRERTNFNSFER